MEEFAAGSANEKHTFIKSLKPSKIDVLIITSVTNTIVTHNTDAV